MVLPRVVGCCFALLVVFAATAASAQGVPPDLGQAERLIGAGRAEEAWRLLSPHESAQAGREEFDYLLGVAALESGRADLATLVFERVLAVNPNHAAARLDMGRAYFALGDFDRARTEFESVRRFGPPPGAAQVIERYLAAMAGGGAPARRRGPAVEGYVEAIAGYDSNVNAATAQSAIFVPLFGVNFDLAAGSRQTRDRFIGLGGGLEATYTGEGGFGAFAGADLRARDYAKADAFDHASGDLRAGVHYAGASDLVRATASRNEYRLDGASYRRTSGLGLEWRRSLDARTQLSAFGQDSRIRYLQSTARSFSSNLLVGGLSLARVLDEASRTTVFGGVYRGTDVATDGRGDGDRRLHGLRAGVQHGLRPDLDAFAAAAFQKSTYEQQNAIFGVLRRDRQYDLSLGLSWQWDRHWLVRPQLALTRNDSTIPLNDYRRAELSVAVRRDWR